MTAPLSPRLTPAERDARLEALLAQMEALLYEARDAHALGGARVIPLDALPSSWRQEVRDEARLALMRQSASRRQAADLVTRRELVHWLAAESDLVLTGVVGVIGEPSDKFIGATLLRRFINRITSPIGPSVITEVLGLYHGALCAVHPPTLAEMVSAPVRQEATR